MKKYLLYIMLVITGFTSCKKGVDPAPGERPEERVATALNTYSIALTGSTNGWKAFLYPSGGGVYLFSMKFGTNNRVNMLSDINVTTSTTNSESSYRLRAQQAPSLLFDTYTYIHLLADPDPSVNGGVAGAGVYSDFEFYFDKVVGDSIMLIGNKLGSKLTLVKATSQTEYENFTKGTTDVLNKLSQLRTYFKRATVGGLNCEIKVNPTIKELTFTYLVAGNLTSTTASFYVNGTTMVFLKPVTIGTETVTEIKSITFDVTSRIFGGTINGGPFQLTEAITPLKYDLTAVNRFNGTAGKQWSSYTGFTRDGVVDYLNVRSISGFSRLVHWIKYNTAYDLVGFTFGNTINYGPAISATVTTGGLLKYNYLGNLGTVPADQAARNTATGNNFAETQGYYVIQTGNSTYDLVGVKDARTWISYQ